MTLLSSQSSSLMAPSGSVSTENPEQRMLEKRAKVIEELLQTERDYIRDLEMCIERIMFPLQQAQVGTSGESELCHEHGSPGLRLRVQELSPQRFIGFEIKVVTAALNSRAPVDTCHQLKPSPSCHLSSPLLTY